MQYVIETVINQRDTFLIIYNAAKEYIAEDGRVEFINCAGAYFFNSISY